MLLLCVLSSVLLGLTAAQSDCYNVTDPEKGKIDYTGETFKTKSGRICQRWDSQSPHAHKKIPENFPNKDLRENYCRDPDNFGYPWCFTTDPEKKRERCAIPNCADAANTQADAPTDCFKAIPMADGKVVISYGGSVNTTVREIPCQKWTVTEPQLHDRTPEKFPGKGLGDHNYCRDPDNTGYPWCYTTDEGVRWEGCSIPNCDDPDRFMCRDPETSAMYEVGDTWTKASDSCVQCECFEGRVVDCFSLECGALDCDGEENVRYLTNQCCPVCDQECMDSRNGYIYSIGDTWTPNPCEECTCEAGENGEKMEACATMDCAMLDEGCEPMYRPGECCPICNEDCLKDDTGDMKMYYAVNDTWSPDACTDCTCIDFGGQKMEMCAQQYCEVPTHCYNLTYSDDRCCPYCGDSPYDECYDFTVNNTILYDGTVSKTKSGKTCQNWGLQWPNTHTRTPDNYPEGLLGFHNFCRDPDNSGYLWCFVDDEESDDRWEECDVPACREIVNPHNWDEEDAEVLNESICVNEGVQIACEKDKRLFIMSANFGATEEQRCFDYNSTTDYCDNTANTTAAIKENCDGKSYCELIPSLLQYPVGDCQGSNFYLNLTFYCKPDIMCYNKEGRFADYNGTRSETKSGRKCMRWNQQRPHGHYFIPEEFSDRGIGEHNYCRDPDGEGRPWCYTMDEEKRWEFCGVPQCEGYSDSPTKMVFVSKASTIIRLIGDAKNINCQFVKEGQTQVTYMGKTNTTIEGRTCQRWTETTPHFHTKMPERYPDAGLGDHNFCRDPDGTGKLWCYTTDPAKRYEFCDIPECSEDEIDQMSMCDDVDCGVGGECFLTNDGNTACLCKPGFMGLNNTCVDINECKREGACGELASCVNSPGSYSCVCPDGYYYNGQECEDKTDLPDGDLCYIPEFIKTPYKRYDINLGEQVIIDCEGDDGEEVYWTKGLDGIEINGTRKDKSSTLQFNKARRVDVDIYRCVLVNKCTGKTRVSRVDIHAKIAPCKEAGLKKYGMVWDAKDWDSAFGYCNSFGLKFAVPRSKSESRTFIQDAWRSYHVNPNGKKFRDTNWIWVAANDRLEENEFTDVDGVSLMAPKWWPSNPDNWKGLDPRGQDEIAFHLFSGYWDDSYGFIERPFACECNFDKESA